VLAALVAAALAGSTLAACGGSKNDGGSGVGIVPNAAAGADPLQPNPLKTKGTITVALSSKLEVYLPILLAQEFGEFDKENLEVKVEYMPPTDSPLLLTQGKVDVIYSAFTAGILNLISANESLRFAYPGGTISSPDQGMYINTKTIGDLDSLTAADFKGKKIITSSGSASSSAYSFWKKASQLEGGADLKPTDITFEPAQLPEVPLILKNGAADGGQVISPYQSQLLGDPNLKVLPGAYMDKPQTGYIVGPSVQKKKDVALAFFRAMARTEKTYLQGAYHSDPKVLAAMVKTMDQPEGALLKSSETVFDTRATKTNAEVIADLQPFYRQFGDLKYPDDMPVDRVYTTEYLDALGLSG